MNRLFCASLLGISLAAAGGAAAAEAVDAGRLYTEHCAACHGADRLGGMGPAMLPENLSRLRKTTARGVIANGLPATQMPAFGDTLGGDQIEALVALIYSPLSKIPQWGMPEMLASRERHVDPATLPDAPVHKADPMNLFVVVEGGDHHVTILDGDSFEPLSRFPSRFALHGGAKFSPDGRFTYFGSRDGTCTACSWWPRSGPASTPETLQSPATADSSPSPIICRTTLCCWTRWISHRSGS
jgi:hypothetical protein